MRIIKNEKSMVTLGNVSLPVSQAMVFSISIGTSALYDSLRYKGTAYQVPTGFKLILIAYRICAGTATACSVTIGSSTVSVSNSTIPTGWTAQSFGGAGGPGMSTPATLGAIVEGPMYNEFAAGVYPGVQGSNTPIASFLGYLVAV